VSRDDIVRQAGALASSLRCGWRDEELTADVLSLASMLEHFAEEIGRGSFDHSKIVGRQIAETALNVTGWRMRREEPDRR
jgi:hypothetical protein